MLRCWVPGRSRPCVQDSYPAPSVSSPVHPSSFSTARNARPPLVRDRRVTDVPAASARPARARRIVGPQPARASSVRLRHRAGGEAGRRHLVALRHRATAVVAAAWMVQAGHRAAHRRGRRGAQRRGRSGRLVPWRDVPATLLLRPLRRGRDVPAMAGTMSSSGRMGCSSCWHTSCAGSVVVAPGDTISAQQTVGTIGASGNTLVPHLHLQALTGADPLAAAPHPFAISSYRLLERGQWLERHREPLPHRRCRVSG
jgi:hypothetical protein